MKQIPYIPGERTPYRTNPTYNERQEELWRIYQDVFISSTYGFTRTRQPEPGQAFNSEEYTEWQDKVIRQSLTQRFYDSPIPYTKEPRKEDIPDNLWQYWYSRMKGEGL